MPENISEQSFGDDQERVIPEVYRELFGPEVTELASGVEIDGVPVTYGLQIAAEAAQWGERITQEGASRELMADIAAGFSEPETQYPGSAMWDRLRNLLAVQFASERHMQAALDLTHGMSSYHTMFDTLMNLAQSDEENSSAVFESFFERFEGSDTSQRLALARAAIDCLIDEDPAAYGALIDQLESVLSNADPSYDPLESWAASQRVVHPEYDWDKVVVYIKNDAKWQGVPVRHRQYFFKLHLATLKRLANENSADLVLGTIDGLNGAGREFPDAKVWDEFRLTMAVQLLHKGSLQFALDFARSIKASDIKQSGVAYFLKEQHEEEALALASTIADGAMLVDTFLMPDWSGNTGATRLTEMVYSDKTPIKHRISMMKKLRDIARQAGHEEQARYFQNDLSALQRQT